MCACWLPAADHLLSLQHACQARLLLPVRDASSNNAVGVSHSHAEPTGHVPFIPHVTSTIHPVMVAGCVHTRQRMPSCER
jgi:hypothetical protein